MMNTGIARRLPTVAALTLVLSACSSPPEKMASLDAARVAYERASQNPTIARHAAEELDAARESLDDAHMLWQAKDSRTEITHHAYLTTQRVMIAELTSSAREAAIELAAVDGESRRVKRDLRAEAIEERRRESLALHKRMQDMQARETDRGMVLTLGDVLFDTGQASLKPGAERNLARISEFLIRYPSRTAIIEGHTDSMGNDDYNMDLSRERAFAVRTAIVSRGVDARRLTTRGYGENVPVAGNDNAYGRQENRRVEIVFPDGRTTVSELAE